METRMHCPALTEEFAPISLLQQLTARDLSAKVCSLVPVDPWTRYAGSDDSVDVTRDCSHCRQDCYLTKFDSVVHAAAFKQCDSRSEGISNFCNLESIEDPQCGSLDSKQNIKM